jgi:ubiquinone biosynthesis protein
VDEDLRRDLEDFLLGVAQKDARRISHTFSRMGATPTDLDRPSFQSDINTLLSYYADIPLGQLNLASAIRELLELVRKHRIVLPPDLALLLTVLVALEGTGRQLDPEFQLMDLVVPYQSKIAMRRYSPARQFRKMQKIGQDLERLMETAPAALSEVARQLENGKFTLQLRVEEIDQARNQLEKSTNRITFGILTASIILASSLLLFKEVPPVIYGYSALGLAGYVLSLFLALRLLWAIYRSGKLN